MILLNKKSFALLVLSGCLSAYAVAQPATVNVAPPYPVKPIRAIVPFVPGGATDIMARSLALKLSEAFGQQVVVDNRAGGGGVIGAVMAKDAPPDGYTIFFGTISTLATNVAVNSKLPYDPVRDYAPITLTSSNPYFLVIHPSVMANSVKEFIALARSRPAQLNYASSGTGGGAHLAGALFLNMARIDLIHVPYKGAAQSLTDLVGGQVHSTFSQPAVMLAHAKAGKLKVLGVTSTKRLGSWQDAPPIAETVPGYESSSWQAVVAPARTPSAIIARLHREIVTALQSGELRKRLLAEGSEIGGMPPHEFAIYMRNEIAKWSKVVKESNIKVE